MDNKLIEKVYISPRGEVHYWRSELFTNEKKTLVFLHGLTADHTLFDMQAEHFSENYNLIIWDAPAHGKSRPYSEFQYKNAAEDLCGILDENSVSSAVMIGQSMGGFITQSFLLRYPERVSAFVGIDTCPYGESYYSASDKWWLRQIEWMAKLYPIGMLKKSVSENCAESAYGKQNMLAALEPYEKNELCRLMGIGFAGFLEDNRDMEIKCPVLIICGEHDKTGKAKQYNRMWAKKTGFPLVWIKNAAHNSNADNPKEVNEAIDVFLGGIK